MECLASIAISQPHAAYAAFTHGLKHKWTYLSRVLSDISDLMAPLEKVIAQSFIPALTGQSQFNDSTRDLLALPVRLGGLGISNPMNTAPSQYDDSVEITAPLTELILQQSSSSQYTYSTRKEQQMIKQQVKKEKNLRQKQAAAELNDKLDESSRRCLELSSEKGSSTWLTALPITEHGFALHKSAFRDAIE